MRLEARLWAFRARMGERTRRTLELVARVALVLSLGSAALQLGLVTTAQDLGYSVSSLAAFVLLRKLARRDFPETPFDRFD